MESGVCLVVDSDFGIDDFVSLVLLSRRSCRPAHLLLVHGNVAPERAAAAAALLHGTQTVPGARQPLVTHAVHVPKWDGHGEDGLGGEFDRVRELLRVHGELCDENNMSNSSNSDNVDCAALRLVRVCRSAVRDGSVSLLLLGPLTNVALALAIDSSALQRAVGRIVVMGGTLHCKGNTTLNHAAEFNFACDPEAAHNVLHAFGSKIELVPWETTLSAPLPREWTHNKSDTVLGLVCTKYAKMEEENELVMCDLVATAVLLEPRVARKRKQMRATVVLSGEARGALLLDWYGKSTDGIWVVEEVDRELMLQVCSQLKDK